MPVRLAILAFALVLTGCGSAGAPVRTNDTTVAIVLDDYTIRPQQLRVPAGKRLTFVVRNQGRLGHTFRIRGKRANVLALTTIRPGRTASKSARLGKGTYTMYCVLANHEELGMNAKLQVG
jgi:plastocyanin